MEGYCNVIEIVNILFIFFIGLDIDLIINKWKEFEVFLVGFFEMDIFVIVLFVKVDKICSIIVGIGFFGGGDLFVDCILFFFFFGIKVGIYIKFIVDVYGCVMFVLGLIVFDIFILEISKINGLQDCLNIFVIFVGVQEIIGEKNFIGGLKVNGGLFDYDLIYKVWKLDGNLLIIGGIIWNVVGDYIVLIFFDLLFYDLVILLKEGGKFFVIGGGGSSGGGNIMLNGIFYEVVNGVIILLDLKLVEFMYFMLLDNYVGVRIIGRIVI